MRENARWSYTELIIIAVVLGVVAVRAVPRFTEASPESRVGELIDGVQKMRIQLDLYCAQHCGCLPDVDSFAVDMTTKVGRYGPYVSKIPANPFNNLNTVRFDGEPAGAGMAGWRLDTETGLFQADDSNAQAGL